MPHCHCGAGMGGHCPTCNGGMHGFGEVTPARVALSTVIVGGAVIAFAVGGVTQAWMDGYFLGRARKKGVTYKMLAKRNAALGGALGAVAAAGILSA